MLENNIAEFRIFLVMIFISLLNKKHFYLWSQTLDPTDLIMSVYETWLMKVKSKNTETSSTGLSAPPHLFVSS